MLLGSFARLSGGDPTRQRTPARLLPDKPLGNRDAGQGIVFKSIKVVVAT